VYALSEIHRIVSVVLDLPLFLSKCEVHFRKDKISVIAVGILWHIENHVIILSHEVAGGSFILFQIEGWQTDV